RQAAWASAFRTPKRPSTLRVCSSSRTYFCVTALVATPPPADFTQTEVVSEVTPRNAHLPFAALTLTPVAMAIPAQLLPGKIETLAAKPPPGIREFTPCTRSSPVLRTCWARLMLTVSVAPGGGAAAPTVSVSTPEVLARKSRLPP